ncbi:hypothetical protein [Absicoccus intestinalis]|uniref:DUF5626 domain-containing protein n=1 Tax=Absicoccus intestinalis TaxID=2926319 RepID=A0ABU4WL26_9FIRM|nr:hypothetical protein [Absicoccus sp. CLA-KB-P134]MDX8416948.1 hypothetical protein [Absicoccus sp. CLA-KB-P134]
MFNVKAESNAYKLMTYADVSYSTTEHDTGATWIDGKKIYAITIKWENQALNNTVSFAHGISNIDVIVDYKAIYCDGDSYVRFPITGATSDKTVGLRINATKVTITGTDTYSVKSGRNLYVTIYYTKTV